MTPFRLAYLNLIRRKIPTLIAIAAISLSVTFGGILYRLFQLSQARFASLAVSGDAIVGAKAGGIEILLGALNGEGDYPDFIPFALYESLKAQQTVRFEDGVSLPSNYTRAVIPMVYFAKYENYRVIGTDETFLNRPRSSESLFFQSGQWATGAREAVVGSRVADANNLKVGDIINLHPWTEANPSAESISYKVTGVLKETGTIWDRTLFSNLTEARDILQKATLKNSIWGPKVLHYYLIYLDPSGLLPLKNLVNKRTVAQVISVKDEIQNLQDLTGTGQSLGFFITAFIIILGGLCVTAMLVTRFESMNVQLAVLRAIGFQRQEIAKWLLWEGFLLGICSVIAGAFLDCAVFPVFKEALGKSLPTLTMGEGGGLLLAYPVWITALLATILAVFIPLYRLYRQDVHLSLKGL